MNPQEIAKVMQEAALTGRPIQQWTEKFPEFSVESAYQVQECLLEMGLSKGERLSGYKMGLTSKAKQRDVGVDEAIQGFLLERGEIQKGGILSLKGGIHPRVEPEIAVMLAKPLPNRRVTLRDVQDAVGFVGPALEIVDSRYENFQFRLPDVIADNTSASHYMVGARNYVHELSELALFAVTVRKNGRVVQTGAPAAALGDPLLSVVELANGLQKRGKKIEPGLVVLTGGLTASTTLKSGDVMEVTFPGETLTLFIQ